MRSRKTDISGDLKMRRGRGRPRNTTGSAIRPLGGNMRSTRFTMIRSLGIVIFGLGVGACGPASPGDGNPGSAGTTGTAGTTGSGGSSTGGTTGVAGTTGTGGTGGAVGTAGT